jgi:hypothetical protein
MAFNKKYIIPGALAIVGIYYIIRSLRKTSSVLDSNGNVDTGSGTITTPTPTSNIDFPLKKGSKGPLVKRLQQAIGVDKLPKYKDDGDFGSETLAALKLVTAGKTEIKNLAEIDAIAAQRGLVWSKSQYVPKNLAAPKNDPLGSYYYGQNPYQFQTK